MSPLFSIEAKADVTLLRILGLKIKLTRAKSLEHPFGGPYGMYDLLKQQAGVPICPGGVISQHGWTTDNALPTDLRNAKYLMLCWNRRYKEDWERKSAVPCLVTGAPFAMYRQARGITVDADARGTIAFPAHSLASVEVEFSLDAYCEQLKALPEQFQPVTICLHPTDILCFNRDKEYEKRGFATVCAGLRRHDSDRLRGGVPQDDPAFKAACAGFNTTQPFYEAFYDMLRRHRFATSNVPGSYVFYAVEMDQPFFLLGQLPTQDNRSGINLDMPAQVNVITDTDAGSRACELFTTPPATGITDAQRAFVRGEMGLDDRVDSAALGRALRKAAVDEHLSNGSLAFTLATLKRILRHPFHAAETLRFHRFVKESARLLGQG